MSGTSSNFPTNSHLVLNSSFSLSPSTVCAGPARSVQVVHSTYTGPEPSVATIQGEFGISWPLDSGLQRTVNRPSSSRAHAAGARYLARCPAEEVPARGPAPPCGLSRTNAVVRRETKGTTRPSKPTLQHSATATGSFSSKSSTPSSRVPTPQYQPYRPSLSHRATAPSPAPRTHTSSSKSEHRGKHSEPTPQSRHGHSHASSTNKEKNPISQFLKGFR